MFYFRLTLFGLLLFAFSANAAFMRWDDYAAYQSEFALTPDFVQEDFTAIADGTSLLGQTINGITYLAPGNIAIGTNADPFIRIGIANQVSGGVDGFSSQTLHFQFSRAVSSFGIRAYEDHQGRSGLSTWDLLVSNGNDGVALLSAPLSDSPSMSWNSVFLGISQTSATDFRFLRTFSDFDTPWSLLEISYVFEKDTTTVSEASSLTLWAAILVLLIGMRGFRSKV